MQAMPCSPRRRHAGAGRIVCLLCALLTFKAPADRRALLQLCILQNLVELGRKGLRRAAPSLRWLRNSRLGVRHGSSCCLACPGSRSSGVFGHDRAAKQATRSLGKRALRRVQRDFWQGSFGQRCRACRLIGCVGVCVTQNLGGRKLW